MSTISKKKSFWKEFYEHYKGGIKTALHILEGIAAIAFIVITSILITHFHLLDRFLGDADFTTKFILIITFEIVIIIGIILIILIIDLIIKCTTNFISQTKAIKRYTYLPLTANEVKLMIAEGVITTDRDYTYYLTDNVIYKYFGNKYCLNFTDEDMKKIVSIYEEVFNKPLILDSEYYKKYKCSYLSNSIPNIIWSTNYPFNYKNKVKDINREDAGNPVVFVHKDNLFEKIENANYIYIDNE